MLPLATRTRATLEAQRLVRDPSLFKWYAVALLAFVVYAYAVEVERGRFDIIAAGLALWLADWFNEIVNALVLKASDTAPLWATTGPTAYQARTACSTTTSASGTCPTRAGTARPPR
jgi:hypothetical protein